MFANAKGKQQWKIRQLQSQEQRIDHIPNYRSGLSRAHFSVNLSRNSCIDTLARPAGSTLSRRENHAEHA